MKPFGHIEGHCPAMKVGDQLQKDGRRVSFLIPQDAAPPDLVNAPMGTKFMIAYALYTEAEKAPGLEGGPVRAEMKGGLQAPALPPAGQAQGPKSEGERALQRCAILCREVKFQLWASKLYFENERKRDLTVADFVRSRCGLTSRSQIATDPAAMQRWLQLETKYLQDTDQLAEVRG